MRFTGLRIAVLVLGVLGAAAWASAVQVTLAEWTFESFPSTYSNTGQNDGPHTPEAGLYAIGSSARGFHSSASTTWSSPVGNASPRSWSSNNWSVGDYYQFAVPTLLYEQIQISWHQTGSNTGPRDFSLQYSTDGTSFTSHADYSITNDSWSSLGSPNPASIYSFDLSSITALDNQVQAYFRLAQRTTTSITGGTVATGGTGRVDNVTIQGTLIPEPAALGLVGLAGLAMIRRRQ